MKHTGYFFYYFMIYFFLWLIAIGIVANLVWDWLAAILSIVTFFGLFPYAWSQAGVRVKGSGTKHANKMATEEEESSEFTVSVTTSYDRPYEYRYGEVKNSRWYGKGEQIEVQDQIIQDPLIYAVECGKKSPACHVIPTKLKAYDLDESGSIGYWPSYSSLTPYQRGKFLKWLATGKKDTEIDIGYVFIYFYGLEYRVVIEGKDLEEICKEVIRLRKYYASNRSFQGYSERLIAYILSKLKNRDATTHLFEQIENHLEKYSIIYRSGINLKLNGTSNLTVDDMTNLVPSFDNVVRSSIPNKVGKYFDTYFKIIAESEINDAILKTRTTEYDEPYYPASSYVARDRKYKGFKITIDRKTQNRLSKKWEEAIDAFRPYSRNLTKKTPEEIFNLLPIELRKTLDHPLKEKLTVILNEFVGRPVSLAEITKTLGMSTTEKISQKDCKELTETLLSQNIIIEPDLTYFKKSYKIEELVYLSKTEIASSLDGDNYKLAALMADFGADLAHSDGVYSDKEAIQIFEFVSANFAKNEIEKERLRLRVELYKSSKPKMSGLHKKLSEKLNLGDLKILGEYLVRVALADGRFTIEEDKKIRTTLSKLGLEEAFVNDLYNKFGINGVAENVELKAASSRRKKGSIIPKISKEMELDKEKLAQLSEDTKKVKSVLSEILAIDEQDSEILEIEEPLSSESSEGGIELDEIHKMFLDEVIQKNEWSKKDLREKAKEFKLMVNAAVSKINDWADEKYGDYLIYEEENYQIQTELLTDEAKSSA